MSYTSVFISLWFSSVFLNLVTTQSKFSPYSLGLWRIQYELQITGNDENTIVFRGTLPGSVDS